MDITIDDERIAELAIKYGLGQDILCRLKSAEERKIALDETEIFLLNAVRWFLVESEDIKDVLEIINRFGYISLCGIFADEYLLELQRRSAEIDGDSLDLTV